MLVRHQNGHPLLNKHVVSWNGIRIFHICMQLAFKKALRKKVDVDSHLLTVLFLVFFPINENLGDQALGVCHTALLSRGIRRARLAHLLPHVSISLRIRLPA